MDASKRAKEDQARALAEARAERDAALKDLAAARADLAALRLRLRWLGELEPTPVPEGVGPGEPPLRYVLVDKANEGVKQLLGPLQKRMKGLVGKRGSSDS
jgi:hypothetical protein